MQKYLCGADKASVTVDSGGMGMQSYIPETKSSLLSKTFKYGKQKIGSSIIGASVLV